MFKHVCFEKTAARRRTNLANLLPLEPPQDNYHLELNEERKSAPEVKRPMFKPSFWPFTNDLVCLETQLRQATVVANLIYNSITVSRESFFVSRQISKVKTAV